MSLPRVRPALVWLGVLAAFGPTIAGILSEAQNPHFQWSVLLAPALVTRLSLGEGRGAPRRGVGIAVIGLGVSLQWLGLATDAAAFARLGLPVACLGAAYSTGIPHPTSAFLLFAGIPIPFSLQEVISPDAEGIWAATAATAVSALGGNLRAGATAIVSAVGQLALGPWDSGVRMSVVVAALAWYAARLEHRSFLHCAALAAVGGIVGGALHAAGVVIAGVLLLARGPAVAEIWMANGIWISAITLALPWIEIRHRSRGTASLRVAPLRLE